MPEAPADPIDALARLTARRIADYFTNVSYREGDVAAIVRLALEEARELGRREGGGGGRPA
jgi:hypothetical protein